MKYSVSFLITVLFSITLLAGQPVQLQIPLGFSILGSTIPIGADLTIPDGFSELEPETNLVLPHLMQEQRDKGYVTFVKNYLEPVYPVTRPLPGEISNQVFVFSSLDEYEIVTFSIHALRDISNVEVVLDDLSDLSGNVFQAYNVDIRAVRCLPRRVWKENFYMNYPTLLEKPQRIDIERRFTQRFWITTFVPKNTSPGLYFGKIHIRAEGINEFNLDLTLKVLPFKLQSPAVYHGMYYTPADFLTSNPMKPLNKERIRRDVLNMKEHGMNTLFLSIPPLLPTGKAKGDIWIDLTPIQSLIEICEEAGLNPIIFNTTISELFENPLADFGTMMKVLVSEFRNHDWFVPIFSVGDESDANGTIGNVRTFLTQIKQNVPESTTYSTIVFPDHSEWLEPNLDIRAFSSYADNTVVLPTKIAGRQLWMYSGTSGYGKDPKGDRFYRGMWANKINLDGVLDWTYFRPSDMRRPFNDLVTKTGRPNFDCWVFPGVDGPLPSPGWEAIREGIDDGRYIFTLTTLIERAKTSRRSNLVALAQEAEDYLEQVFSKISTSPKQRGFPVSVACEDLKADFFNAFRLNIGRYIAFLKAEL